MRKGMNQGIVIKIANLNYKKIQHYSDIFFGGLQVILTDGTSKYLLAYG